MLNFKIDTALVNQIFAGAEKSIYGLSLPPSLPLKLKIL